MEVLEERTVPSTLSVTNNVTVTEGAGTYRFIDDFVAPNGYGLAAARNILIGPDGNVYVASHDTNVVKVFEPGTVRFVRDLGTAGGELVGPWGMTFGPDGLLYVGGRYSQNVVRFNIATGAYTVFVNASSSGGLGAAKSLAFGPDGNLYVTSDFSAPWTNETVKRYSATTGAYMDDFVQAGSGGLGQVSGLAFGPDGNLYVLSPSNGDILRYDGRTGNFLDIFIARRSGALGINSGQMLFHDGELYVCDGNDEQLLLFNASTGALLGH